MKTSQTSFTSTVAVLCAAGLVGSIEFGPIRAQSAPELQKADPPAHAVWVDSLDLSKASIRRPRAGRGGRGAAPPPGPPPPLKFVLGGVDYPHAVPLNADSDLVIDLKGQAVRFQSMVGVDDGVGSGRGSVEFGVWVDDKKVADTGVMRGGDAAKLLSVDVAKAKRLVLAVNDGNDGTANDNADWAGALITMTDTATGMPEVAAWPAEIAPVIAPSRSPVPTLNYPRITGATPGRPFMFLIPASGEGPLAFAAKNLPAGVTLSPASPYAFVGLVEADYGATLTGVTSAHQWMVSPLIGIGNIQRASNSVAIDTWAGFQFSSANSLCVGSTTACGKLGNMVRVGTSLKF